MTQKPDRDNFYAYVYDLVRSIPAGRVTSYGAIAKCIGTGMSSRMVGWAMNNAPSDVPAHRVVNRKGMLTGKHAFGDPLRMQFLLESEGIIVRDDVIQHFSEVFWDPQEQLAL